MNKAEKRQKATVSEGKISELKFDDKNFNRHTEFGMSLLEKSLRRNGAGRSIVVDKDNRIIGGNGIVETAASIGLENTIVVETTGDQLVVVKRTDVDLDSKQGREMALADNATAAADFDLDLELIKVSQEEYGFDSKEWGIDLIDVSEQEQTTAEATEDDFDEDKDFIAVKCKKGDIWKLGNHRLMCGDSIQLADVQKLMGGGKADMIFTDPPFGNNLGYGRGQLGERRIANDEDTSILYNFFHPMDSALKNDTHCLVWIQWRTFSELEKAFEKYKLRTVVIWDKMQAGLSGGGFAEQYEMLCVFIKGKATQNKYSGNVWQVPRVHANREDMPHPHQKPIEVLSRGLELCSKEGDLVLDLFGGSGSTMMACEQLNRRCYMMELDPHYCDVIIARWEKLTGKKAELINV